MNSFSLGAQVGGPDYNQSIAEQQLRDLFNTWRGNYTTVVREFAFILRIDASIQQYTDEWKILGAQPAKRKRDWVEVEIGVPVAWWRDMSTAAYKVKLCEEIEKGLQSIVNLLRRNHHKVNVDALFSDWNTTRSQYLTSPTKQATRLN